MEEEEEEEEAEKIGRQLGYWEGGTEVDCGKDSFPFFIYLKTAVESKTSASLAGLPKGIPCCWVGMGENPLPEPGLHCKN